MPGITVDGVIWWVIIDQGGTAISAISTGTTKFPADRSPGLLNSYKDGDISIRLNVKAKGKDLEKIVKNKVRNAKKFNFIRCFPRSSNNPNYQYKKTDPVMRAHFFAS